MKVFDLKTPSEQHGNITHERFMTRFSSRYLVKGKMIEQTGKGYVNEAETAE